MLHKKKRWTAAIHATGQPAVSALTPSSVSSPKSQRWPGHNSTASVASKQHPRYSTPAAFQVNQKFPPSSDTSVPLPLPSPVPLARPSSMEELPPGSRFPVQSTQSCPTDSIATAAASTIRTDLSSSLLAAIANSPGLLHHPGFMLHILPQECPDKYPKVLEKCMTPNKSVFDSTDKPTDFVGKPGERSTLPPNVSSSFQPSHRSCSSFGDPGHQLAPRVTTTPTNISPQIPVCRPGPTESTKMVRTSADVRVSVIGSHNQTSSVPCSFTSTDASHKNAVSSVGQHSQKVWNAGCVPAVSDPQRQQQLSSLDYSTISAVARAASLFNSSHGVNAAAAAALLQQWDVVNQMNLKCSGGTQLESLGHRTIAPAICTHTTLSPQSIHTSYHSHIPSMGRMTTGNIPDSQKCRSPTELVSQVVNRMLAPGVSNTTQEIRRPTPKSTLSSNFLLESRTFPSSSASTSTSCASNKACRTAAPWLSTGGRSDSGTSLLTACHVGVSEAADTRLSILQDAKVASLSVDWTLSTSSMGNITATSKPQRARSSTSFSWPTSSSSSSVSELSPPLQSPPGPPLSQSPHHYSTHNRCVTASLRDVQRIPAASSNLDIVSPNSTNRGRQAIMCTSPYTSVGSAKSTQNPSSPFFSDSSSNRLTGFPHTSGMITVADTQPLKVAASHLATNRFRPNGSLSPGMLILRDSSPNTVSKTNFCSLSGPIGVDAEPAAAWSTTPPMAQKLSSPLHVATSSTPPSFDFFANRSSGTVQCKNPDSRSLMPLKKRLIQRYEADNISTKTLIPNIVQDNAPSVPSPNLGNIGSSMDVEQPIKTPKIDPIESGPGSALSAGARSMSGHLEDDIEKNSPPSQLCMEPSKSTGGLKTSRKLSSNVRTGSDSLSTPSVLGSKSPRPTVMKSSSRRNDDATQRGKPAGRMPKRVGSRPCSNPSVNESNENSPKRRVATDNGTTFLMVSPRTHHSDSSTSSRSSSSSHRGSAADDTDADGNLESDATEHERRSSNMYTHHKLNTSSTAAPDHRVSNIRPTLPNAHTIGDRMREPKRAAALAASAATAASATGGVKRPRFSPSRSSAAPKRRATVGPDEGTGGDGEDSMSADDASSVVTSECKSNSTSNPVLDEFSAALMEEKWPLEDLSQRLPGPPDLNALTNHSIRPTHSLEYYKQSRTAFIQLVSCNDPGLKQVPKCRACRQVKRSHFDVSASSVNGDDSGVSDEDCKDKVGAKTPPHGHFKRPSGRNAQVDREKTGDAGESERTKSDRPRSRRNQPVSPVSVFCRFWGFRKLIFNNRGVLKIAGFCQSNEANPTDRSLWDMHHSVSPHLEPSNAKYILERAGTLFCRLLRQELAVLSDNRDREPVLSRGPGAPPKNGLRANPVAMRTPPANVVAWKRPVKGVREMCDVCETTMFNTHWVCAKCGYSICVHCYEEARAKKEAMKTEPGSSGTNEAASFREKSKGKLAKARAGLSSWASCTTTRQHHDLDRLLLTSLMPACTIGKLLYRVHRIARRYRIRLGCDCVPDNADTAEQCHTKLEDTAHDAHPMGENSLDLLADLALKRGHTESSSTHKGLKSEPIDDGTVSISHIPHTWILGSGLMPSTPSSMSDTPPKEGTDSVNARYRVLQLHDPDSADALAAFQAEWRHSRPVVVSGCGVKFDPQLWSPHSFAEEFGQLRTTLVDCATSIELTRYPLRTFWDGFERKSRRLVSKDGRPMCLKLKDWPTTDDFAELQPRRFADLMGHLPMPSYTCRDGQLNLASRLSSFFVCPDLGPKLYMAYGTGVSRSIGTTNLHVDIADAINVLLYVGHPSDSLEESTANAEAVLNVMRQAQVDPIYVERAVRWARSTLGNTAGSGTLRNPVQPGEDSRTSSDPQLKPPGALWHIFLPEDMPALRRFLTQITEEETGAPLEPGSDPIHDQLFYLDRALLDRLYSSTGVLPCTLVQFTGDAVFIPAGAAHQVRNLNSCIKAAVDFVSSEHLPQCFQLIEEFRRLSSTHQNHEDKLQIKNMLFHAVKDALSVLVTAPDSGWNSTPRETSEPGEELLAHKLFSKTLESGDRGYHVTTNASLLNEEDECRRHPQSLQAIRNVTTGSTDHSSSPSSSNSDHRHSAGKNRSGARPARCRSTAANEDSAAFDFSGRLKNSVHDPRCTQMTDGFPTPTKSSFPGMTVTPPRLPSLPSPSSQPLTVIHRADSLGSTHESGSKGIVELGHSSV